MRSALTAVGVLALVWVTGAQSAQWGPYPAQYVRAYDGDTVTLRITIWPALTKVESVRLAGIDTPEIRGDCDSEKRRAREARDFVRERLTDAELRVTISEIGKYGRAVGRITVDGEDLGQMLLDRGHARPYDGGQRLSWCEERE